MLADFVTGRKVIAALLDRLLLPLYTRLIILTYASVNPDKFERSKDSPFMDCILCARSFPGWILDLDESCLSHHSYLWCDPGAPPGVPGARF
jgi:hypothetical protein